MDRLDQIKGKLTEMDNECQKHYSCQNCPHNNAMECNRIFGEPTEVLKSILALEEMMGNDNREVIG